MLRAIKGTKDLFGDELDIWLYTENIIHEVCKSYCFKEIRTPMFEATELFVKGAGDTTDIVQKEMYTFTVKSDKSLTLKPEVTAPVARAFLEHSLYGGTQPTKLYYISPCFRYEQPQSGRQRQFHQFGIEYFGAYGSGADAEVISMGYEVIKKLGIKNTVLHINSLGTYQSRKVYNKQLKDYLKENYDDLCPTCQERTEKNPLRVLDCKVENCNHILKSAPNILDSLDDDGKTHFEDLQKILSAMNIDFVVNPKIVRGLDYYTKTVFEFLCDDVGAQSTICGGGRYDNMLEGFGGPKMGSVGFAMGMERIVLAMQNQNIAHKEKKNINIFIGFIGSKGFVEAQRIVFGLRQKGIVAETDTLDRSVKAQLKFANKIGAQYSVVIGDEEIASSTINIKNMDTGKQIQSSLSDIENFFVKGEN